MQERTFELKKSEETFRALSENSMDIIARYDKSFRYLYINPIIENNTGIPVDKLIGKTDRELGFPKEIIELKEKAIREVFKTKKEKRIEFSSPVMKQKEKPWLDLQLVPEFDNKGNVVAVIGSARNITKLKKLEKALNLALNNEKNLNKLKTQFISTVSHEFRTPLTSIFSSVDLLELFGDNWTVNKRKAQFGQMRGSINRLTGMLDDVLKVSRLDSGKQTLNFETVNLPDIINGVIGEAKPQFTLNHKLVHSINVPKNNYLLDKEVIRTILLNLISNAIKYSPKGGNIELDVSEKKNNLIFVVGDQGTGIHEKDIKNIFKEFYRAEDTAHIQGTGLGLSIVKGLLDKVKGKINVESELGKGSKFTVTIPIKKSIQSDESVG